MQKIKRERLEALAANFHGKRVLIVGDLMLDEYIWGEVNRISPEAPVPVVRIRSESFRLGGAANVARNVKALEGEPILVGVAGEDRAGGQLRATLQEEGISHEGVIIAPSRPTTIKTRIIAHHQQVVRTDREEISEIPDSLVEKILDRFRAEIHSVNGVIFSDYGKGVLRDDLLREMVRLSRTAGRFVAVDPHANHYMGYRGVTVITPNHHEAGQAFGREIVDEKSLLEVGWGLKKKIGVESVLITLGERGMALFEEGGDVTHFPTVARDVYDVTGAGDTVVAVLAVAREAGATMREATALANHAAGRVVAVLGTAAVTRDELIQAMAEWGDG